MGISERKERERELRRQAILQTTKNLVLSKGVREFSLQDIADHLEISKAALYLFFENKDDILAIILRESAIKFQNFIRQRMDGAQSGFLALKAMGQAYFDFYQEYQDSFILFGIKDYFAPAAPLVLPNSKLNDLIESFIRNVQEAIEQGIVDGSLRHDLEAKQATATTMFIAISLVDKVSRLPADFRNSSLAYLPMKGAFELLLRGLASPIITNEELTLILPQGIGDYPLNKLFTNKE